MKKLFATDPGNTAAFIARLTLGLIVFPHGAQKLLGLFGGYGFTGTMGFLTGMIHLPWILALLVILIEFFGSLLLIIGFGTRLAALGVFLNFIGVIFAAHIHNGFFMNWSAAPNVGEGYEYHLLILGLSVIGLVAGAGRWSVDAVLSKTNNR